MTNSTLYRGELAQLPEGYEWERSHLPPQCRGTLHLGKKEIPLFCSPLIQNPNFLKNFLDLADSELRKLSEAGVNILQIFKICAAHAPYEENTSIRKFAGKRGQLLQCAKSLKSAAAAIRNLGAAPLLISANQLHETLQRILDSENQPFRRSLDDPITLVDFDGVESGEYYPVNADWLAGPATETQNSRTREREGPARPLEVPMRLFRSEWPEQFEEAVSRLLFLVEHVLRRPKHRPGEAGENSFIRKATSLCRKASGRPMDPECCHLFKVTFDVRNFDEVKYRVRRGRLERQANTGFVGNITD